MLLLQLKYFHIQLRYLTLSFLINFLHLDDFLLHHDQLSFIFIDVLTYLFLPRLFNFALLVAFVDFINCEGEQGAIKNHELYAVLNALVEGRLTVQRLDVKLQFLVIFRMRVLELVL